MTLGSDREVIKDSHPYYSLFFIFSYVVLFNLFEDSACLFLFNLF